MHLCLKSNQKRRAGTAAARFASFVGAVILALASLTIEAKAEAQWISPNAEIRAGAAIVMDADSGAVLWGYNINEQCYPASITKLLTALVVLDNCSLDETAEATEAGVYGLEAGAVTCGLGPGDTLSVRELMYAMLLRSANDAANVLAIHVAGNIEEFGKLMTAKAESLGCTGSLFQNPSGLTTPANQTTAHDMALIAQACMNNSVFLELESESSRRISATSKYPDGLTVTIGHKMMRSGTGYTDERVVAGKTGYITASGNTLVTMAEDSGRRVVVVCLKDKNPYHYTDTQKLLDFGLENFENVLIDDPAAAYDAATRLKNDRIVTGNLNGIRSYSSAVLTVPKGADTADITVKYDYNLTGDVPDMAVARMDFQYAGVTVGSEYVINDRESVISIESIEEGSTALKTVAIGFILLVIGGIICGVVALVLSMLGILKKKQAERRRLDQKRRRRRRLRELDISDEEFDEMVKRYGEQHRNRQ